MYHVILAFIVLWAGSLVRADVFMLGSTDAGGEPEGASAVVDSDSGWSYHRDTKGAGRNLPQNAVGYAVSPWGEVFPLVAEDDGKVHVLVEQDSDDETQSPVPGDMVTAPNIGHRAPSMGTTAREADEAASVEYEHKAATVGRDTVRPQGTDDESGQSVHLYVLKFSGKPSLARMREVVRSILDNYRETTGTDTEAEITVHVEAHGIRSSGEGSVEEAAVTAQASGADFAIVLDFPQYRTPWWLLWDSASDLAGAQVALLNAALNSEANAVINYGGESGGAIAFVKQLENASDEVRENVKWGHVCLDSYVAYAPGTPDALTDELRALIDRICMLYTRFGHISGPLGGKNVLNLRVTRDGKPLKHADYDSLQAAGRLNTVLWLKVLWMRGATKRQMQAAAAMISDGLWFDSVEDLAKSPEEIVQEEEGEGLPGEIEMGEHRFADPDDQDKHPPPDHPHGPGPPPPPPPIGVPVLAESTESHHDGHDDDDDDHGGGGEASVDTYTRGAGGVAIPTYGIFEAIDKGLVQVEVMAGPGLEVRLRIKRCTDTPFRLVVPPGVQFAPPSGANWQSTVG